MTVHAKTKKYLCEEFGCGHATANKRSLKLHTRNVHEKFKRNHVCKKFKNAGEGEKDLQCTECGKAFIITKARINVPSKE